MPKSRRRREIKKVYEVDSPVLTDRERMAILTNILEGAAAEDYVKRQAAISMEVSLDSLKNLGILHGPNSAPEQQLIAQISRTQGSISATEKLGLVGRMLYPIAEVAHLKKEQETVSFLAESPEILTVLREQYDLLGKQESAIFSLYSGSKDPMFSSSYQKHLTKLFSNVKGKFVNAMKIEGLKRYSFDFVCLFNLAMLIVFSSAFLLIAISYFFIDAIRKMVKAIFKNSIGKAVFVGGYVLMLIFMFIYSLRITYYSYVIPLRYISERLVAVQRLFEIAKIVDLYVQSHPALEQCCGPRLARTRALLAGEHRNPVYNDIVNRFLTNDFSQWSIIFNSTGNLLVTMQLLRDNIHVLDDVFFELGQVGAYLSAAHLLVDKEHKNSYAMVEFLEDNTRTTPYLAMQGLWSSAVGADVAVANNLEIDGMRHLALLIMGPNACGKSVLTQGAPRAVLLAQTFGIGPFTSCKMTPFGGMYSFKEPQDDPNLKMSLFAFELHCTNEHEALLERCRRSGKFMLTCADERFASTNPVEAAALSVAKLRDTMDNYTNNINIITSHMGYVVSAINRMENAQVRHVQIDRKEDGSYKPRYTLGEGVSKEVVGIDLFKKMVGKDDVVDEARKIFKDIKAGERMADERRRMR